MAYWSTQDRWITNVQCYWEKELDSKGYILDDSIYRTLWKKVKLWEKKINEWLPGTVSRLWGGGSLQKGQHEDIFWGDETVLNLDDYWLQDHMLLSKLIK